VERSELVGCVVLVVEDEPLVSLDLTDMLLAAGAHVVSAKRAGEAILSVDRFQVAAAVLDINLGDHDCAAVCQRLRERGIPFLFHTGYSAGLDGWGNVPLIKKPAPRQEILEAVARLCESHQQAA
jgi:DNA-binding response OmpR family regulator